jgi:hypothetical protein
MDFNSIKHLTDHLKYVASHPDIYSSYFEWKRYLSMDADSSKLIHMSPLCDICIRLHLEEAQEDSSYTTNRKIINNLNKWDKFLKCKTPIIKNIESFNLISKKERIIF